MSRLLLKVNNKSFCLNSELLQVHSSNAPRRLQNLIINNGDSLLVRLAFYCNFMESTYLLRTLKLMDCRPTLQFLREMIQYHCEVTARSENIESHKCYHSSLSKIKNLQLFMPLSANSNEWKSCGPSYPGMNVLVCSLNNLELPGSCS
jgi:hypothetical protein